MGSLSDSAVIHLISTSFVPVALNLYKIRDAKDEGGDFFRSVQRQKPNYLGLWLATWDGRLLAASVQVDPKKALAELREGLSKFGTVTPRRVRPTNPLPYRGIGVRADGSVTLAISDKAIPVEDLSQLPRFSGYQMFLDSVTLSAAEWSALAPPDARAGSEWTIPEEIGRRFFPLLNPFDIKFRDPAEVTEVQLVGRVASVREGIARLVYEGRIAGTHHGTKNEGSEGKSLSSALKMAGGVGAYDIQAGQMLSLTWVWDGRFRSYPPYADPPIRFGAVAEWHQSQPAAAAQLEAKTPGLETNGKLADSTPQDALKTFLVALAAQDEATLHAVTLPDAEFEWLLKSPKAPPDVLARIKAGLEKTPMKRLTAGDRVRMPDGESRVIKPIDVREGRVVLWPDGAPLPSRLENVGGHWKVFARPFIAARKQSGVTPSRVQAESPPGPRPPGR